MEKQKKEKLRPQKTVKKTAIGGQALIEGVMMRGSTAMAMAVRNPDGDIVIEAKRVRSRKKWYHKLPVCRGIAAFGDSLISGVKTLVKSASVAAPEEETPGKFWMGFAVFLGLAMGIGLFFVVPWALNSFVFSKLIIRPFLSALVEGLIRIAIFVGYLFLVSLMKDIRRTFQYHGAEHRTINCFEKDLPMTVKNVQSCSTRHNRCGTTFLFFVMLVSILVFSLVSWLLSLTPLPDAAGGSESVAYRFILLGVRLAFLPLVAGLSYELLKFLAKMPDNWFVAIFRAPGLALQRLTTYAPDDGMAEVALTAFMEVYKMDANPELGELTFGQFRYTDFRARVEKELEQTNADSSETDWIFCDVTGLKRSELRDIKIVTETQSKKIREILTRRKGGEPLWYILGYCEFYGQRLVINHNALIPRFETEVLTEAAIAAINEKSGAAKVLDLCTGSGCIAAALAKNSSAVITASDFSEQALSVASINLDGTGVKVVYSDLFDNLKDEVFDVIVSNPPYIKTADIEHLEIEVKGYEPVTALDGGTDGYNYYRRIVENAPAHLEKGGCLLLEVGLGQAQEVKQLMTKSFQKIEIIKDLDGVERVLKGYKK